MNPSPLQEEHLESLVGLSQQMLDAARSGLWEEVSRLEESRKTLMGEVFSGSVMLPAGSITEAIRFILSADREVLRLGSGARDELRVALKRINTGKGAVQAYKAV